MPFQGRLPHAPPKPSTPPATPELLHHLLDLRVHLRLHATQLRPQLAVPDLTSSPAPHTPTCSWKRSFMSSEESSSSPTAAMAIRRWHLKATC